MHKIHYHMCHTTIQGDSHTGCGKVVKTKFSSKIMDDVTCKACLRCLWALGKRARARINKVDPLYKRVAM